MLCMYVYGCLCGVLRIRPVGEIHVVTNWVFGEAKNTNFLKFLSQCVKHVVAMSNLGQFINKLLHTYSTACRCLSEILGCV